jgi:hypothetical protein
LLAVIAIIAVLAALLLPVLTKAKERSPGVPCLRNSKQLGLAWHVYADDNAGLLVNKCAFNGWAVFSGPQTGWPIEALNWVYGIMDWTIAPEDTNSQLIANGLLFPYTLQAKICKCPADRYLSPQQEARGHAQRVRSASMNMFVKGSAVPGQYWLPGYAAYTKEVNLIAPAPSQL